MSTSQHWDSIYAAKEAESLSWYCPHLETSLEWIERAAGGDPSARILDVGCGVSSLASDLVARGYTRITALDISPMAIDRGMERLGLAAGEIDWLCFDVTQPGLPVDAFTIWHDRAVFHFLTGAGQRKAYRDNVRSALQRNGHLIISTFGPEGPLRCSGLDVIRYDGASLIGEFGPDFAHLESRMELHTTPSGASQQFLACWLKYVPQL